MASSTTPNAQFRSPSPEEDVAAAMGFASFGSKPKPAKKKRKIVGADANHEGSGSNNTPLGVRMKAAEEKNPGAEAEWKEPGYYEPPVNGENEDVPYHLLHTGDLVDGYHIGQNKGYQPRHQPEESKDKTPSSAQSHNNGGQETPKTLQPTSIKPSSPAIPGQDSNGNWDYHALRRGIIDTNGDTAYYLPSFISDPWQHLRKPT